VTVLRYIARYDVLEKLKLSFITMPIPNADTIAGISQSAFACTPATNNTVVSIGKSS